MSRNLSLVLVVLSVVSARGESWTQFRGPNGDGKAPNQTIPVEFGESKNVTWKTPLPGRAWSSPVIADGTIWATTAIEVFPNDDEREKMLAKQGIEKRKFKQLQVAKQIELKLIAIDFATGKITRTIDLVTVEQPDAIHSLNSYASPTPVIDGERIYCHFGTFGTFCLDRKSGDFLWKRQFPVTHGVGPGSSPFIYQDRLVLIHDGIERQYVSALNKLTGETLWETERPEMDAPTGDQKKAYCTPIAIKDSNGREQLVCMASQWMVAYQPKTGDELWRIRHGKGFSVVPRPVFSDGLLYFSTGFGKPELWAIKVDGSGDVTDTHVEWVVKKSIPAKPSPLVHDGLVYVMEDSGIASCFDAKTGDEVWKKRIGGKFSASPLLASGHIFLGSHDGVVTVIKPGREANVVAENQLDGQIMASPAVVDNAMILRTAKAIYRIEAQ